MHRGERLDEREAEPGAFLGAHMLALHLLEGLAETLDVFEDAARSASPR